MSFPEIQPAGGRAHPQGGLMIARCILLLAAILMLWGCSGVQKSAVTGEGGDASSNTGATTAANGTEKPDKKAQEAKVFCEHEIKKSASSAFELLNKKQVAACLLALRPQINAQCAKGVEKEIILKIIIGNDGKVVGAFPVGDGADSEEATCVAKIIRPAVFPRFSSREQQVIEKYPFQIQP